MWEIDISLQVLFFLRSILLGMIYCLFYDILRGFRRVFSYSDWAVSLQDLFYFLIITPTAFLFLLAATNGEVRFYILFGIAIGFTIFRLTVSRVLILFLKLIISVIYKSFTAFFNFISGVIQKIKGFIAKKSKKIKKLLKKA